MCADYVEQFREQGYAVVRGLFPAEDMKKVAAAVDRIYADAIRHPRSWRHKNLYYEIADDPERGRIVLQAHWPSWKESYLERLRRDERYLEVLRPLVGDNLKQITNQIYWKPPGAKLDAFRYHQDVRFREPRHAFRDLETSYVTTGLAIDPHRPENGCLEVFPGSHKMGYLGLSDRGPLMKGETSAQELHAAGLHPADAVDLVLEPGDLALWNLYTVHGSGLNTSSMDRRFHLNSYVKAENSNRGEWAFKNGVSCPLGDEPVLVRYEALYDRPEPHYVDDSWHCE